jgi:phytoene/squalene synthetase
MADDSAALARSITRSSSRQSYLTAYLLADRDLVDDCCRAYGYFRWADDVVDGVTPLDGAPTTGAASTREERIAFIRHQRELIDLLYQNGRPDNLAPEEQIVADLISHDRGENSGLQSFIRNFLAIIDFDAYRRGRHVSQAELDWYSDCLGQAVTDAIQYFVGNDHTYPRGTNQYLAATAAHITHMLRDMVEDLSEGYVNVPREYLDEHGLRPQDLGSPAMRAWVRSRVRLARRYFRDGKRYIDSLDVLRCKIAARWYCARFEGLLDIIERDDYILRPRYSRQRKLSAWLRMAALAAWVSLQHLTGRFRRRAPNRPSCQLKTTEHPVTQRLGDSPSHLE